MAVERFLYGGRDALNNERLGVADRGISQQHGGGKHRE